MEWDRPFFSHFRLSDFFIKKFSPHFFSLKKNEVVPLIAFQYQFMEGGGMEEDPLGEHYLIELYECNKGILDNLAKIKQALLDAARMAGATIIDQRFHKFSPQGVSGVVVIAESHLSIHTWPELGYAALDLFTCSHDMNIGRAMELLRQVFEPGDAEIRYVRRGIMNPARRKADVVLVEPEFAQSK
jgi:S-adenosylmethionine decarboxylase proenzyme